MRPEPSGVIAVLHAQCRECTDWPMCDDCRYYTTARSVLGMRQRRRKTQTDPPKPRKSRSDKGAKRGGKGIPESQDMGKEPEAMSGDHQTRIMRIQELMTRVMDSHDDRMKGMAEFCGKGSLVEFTDEELDRYEAHLEELYARNSNENHTTNGSQGEEIRGDAQGSASGGD